MPGTTRAAAARAVGKPFAIEEMPVPEMGPGRVLMRVVASGVCHTDPHAARGDWTDTHNLAEGAGAAPLAAAMAKRGRIAGRRIGVILRGGKIDLALFRSWVLGEAP